ncbi:MAG: phosphohistidine phosphatase SixA [Gemmatimonadota bacterium]
MKLYLVRHGDAVPKDKDSQRPLSESGADVVRRVTSFLRSSGLKVDEVRHSTKLRARQTAEIIVEGLVSSTPLREVSNLEPLAEVGELANELGGGTADLMLVGHLPHLNLLASRLTCGDEHREVFEFPAGGVLCLEHRAESADWVVQWLLAPALLE